jgi:hypothetical protein
MRKLRQGTARCRQIDVEGVVRLPGDLKPWGCHANQYGIVRPELYSAWLVLDRQHPHMPYIAVDILPLTANIPTEPLAVMLGASCKI